MKALRIRGGEVVHPQKLGTAREDVWICGRHIAANECGEATILDASGLYVAPGFIDLQVDGGVGHNFEDASVEQIDKIAGFHASHEPMALTRDARVVDSSRASRGPVSLGRLLQLGHHDVVERHVGVGCAVVDLCSNADVSGCDRGVNELLHLRSVDQES